MFVNSNYYVNIFFTVLTNNKKAFILYTTLLFSLSDCTFLRQYKLMH